MNREYTFSKSTVECYKFRHSSGMYWADITIDAQGHKGRIQIASDFGNWQNFWGACGKPFKEFLLHLNMEYVADKFNADRWFDHQATIVALYEEVKNLEKSSGITKSIRKELLAEIKSLEDFTHEQEFVHRLWECPRLMQITDGTPDLERSVTPGFRQFWERIWPLFTYVLKQELAATDIAKEVINE